MPAPATGRAAGSVQPATAYLDSASAEPLHPAAREAYLSALDQGFADPRRLHGPARTARLLLDNARAAVAECLAVRPDEVFFTPSGTDAVHRGLLGLLAAGGGGGPAAQGVAHSAVEHSAVLHAAAWAAGPSLVLPVDQYGRVPVAGVTELLATPQAAEVGAVAVQAANHEVGTRQPVSELADQVGGRPVFVDACALMGRLPLPSRWSALAGSAHKWGGPAGVGVLLVAKGTRWRNPFPGEATLDESGVGFPNVPAIFAAAAALQAVVAERAELNRQHTAWIDQVRAAVAAIPDVEVVGDPHDRLPHLVTFSCLYLQGEALVSALDQHGYGVASGSACTAATLEPSHVLAAMGVLTHGNVRLSLTRQTTQADVDGFLRVLPEVVRQLRAEVGA